MSFVPYTQQPLFKDWKANVIDWTPNDADLHRVKLFAKELGNSPTPYLQVFATHTWKVTFTPQWSGEAGWLSLKCARKDHPLSGKTLNVANVDATSWLLLGAWVVEFIAGCTEGQIDAFLNGGSDAAVNFVPETPENQELDDEIPF